MWANLTADKFKHLLHLQPVCYTYNPLFVTLTTCLLHLQTRCYTYNLFATLKPHYSLHLNLFVTLTTSYATLTTTLFVTLTTSLLHLQPLCYTCNLFVTLTTSLFVTLTTSLLHLQPLSLLHLQPLCYTYNFFVTLTTTVLHWQPLLLLHFHPLCARHGCTTVGLPGRGMRPASLRGPLQQPSLRQQRHGPGLQARGQLSAERAGGERGAERGVQEQLRALARPGGLWAHGGLGPHAGHVLRTWAHCGFRVKWDRCWGHGRTVGLGWSGTGVEDVGALWV